MVVPIALAATMVRIETALPSLCTVGCQVIFYLPKLSAEWWYYVAHYPSEARSKLTPIVLDIRPLPRGKGDKQTLKRRWSSRTPSWHHTLDAQRDFPRPRGIRNGTHLTSKKSGDYDS